MRRGPPRPSWTRLTPGFGSNRNPLTLSDIYIAERALATDPWTTPQRIPSLSTSKNEQSPHLSADKLTIFFQLSVNNTGDLFYATRPALNGTWGQPVPITGLNTTGDESDPWVSPPHLLHARSRRDRRALGSHTLTRPRAPA